MKRESYLRINDIRENTEKILTATKNVTEKEFIEDIILQSAVIRWLEIIGEAAKYAPQEIKNKILKCLGKKWQRCAMLLFMIMLISLLKIYGKR